MRLWWWWKGGGFVPDTFSLESGKDMCLEDYNFLLEITNISLMKGVFHQWNVSMHKEYLNTE